MRAHILSVLWPVLLVTLWGSLAGALEATDARKWLEVGDASGFCALDAQRFALETGSTEVAIGSFATPPVGHKYLDLPGDNHALSCPYGKPYGFVGSMTMGSLKVLRVEWSTGAWKAIWSGTSDDADFAGQFFDAAAGAPRLALSRTWGRGRMAVVIETGSGRELVRGSEPAVPTSFDLTDDGRWLFYATPTGGIRLVNVDARTDRLVVAPTALSGRDRRDQLLAAADPTGSHLAILGPRSGSCWLVAVSDGRVASPVALGSVGSGSGLAWSPQGPPLLAAYGDRMFVANAQKPSERAHAARYRDVGLAAWEPTSRRLFFIRTVVDDSAADPEDPHGFAEESADVWVSTLR